MTDEKDAPSIKDDDILGVVGDNPPILPPLVKEVVALCKAVDLKSYRGIWDHRYVFTMQVVKPDDFEGMKLVMYARWREEWKTLPVKSKLWKLARRATGEQFKAKQKITKSLFLKKLFRCRVRLDENGDYTVIDTIIERVTL